MVIVRPLPQCGVTSGHCALLMSHFKLVLLLGLVAACFSGEQKSWLLSSNMHASGRESLSTGGHCCSYGQLWVFR